MNIEKRILNNIFIYDFEGRIDFHPYDLLDNSILKDAIENKAGAVLLNFTNLKYISSLGIRYIYDIKNELSQFNIFFAISGASDTIQQVFKLLGLYDTFPLHETESEGVDYLESYL